MNPPGVGESRVQSAASIAVLAAGACFILAYLAVGLLRIWHPYELMWMEGEVLEHVRRVAAGEPLYVAPTFEFTPLIYTPLFYYTSALVSMIVGEGFTAMRGVSLAIATWKTYR